MANTVSQAFKEGKFFEASHNLVVYFNNTFPLPQLKSWKEFHLPKELTSPMITCLLGKQQQLASLLRQMPPEKNTGGTGLGTHKCATWTRSSTAHLSPHLKETSSPELLLLGSGAVCSALESKSRLEASRTLSLPSQRPLSWLDNQVPYTKWTKNTSSPSSDKSKDTEG